MPGFCVFFINGKVGLGGGGGGLDAIWSSSSEVGCWGDVRSHVLFSGLGCFSGQRKMLY